MMDDQADWLKNNDEYLAKSVAWLRLRLLRLAQRHNGTPNVLSPAAEFSTSAAKPCAGATSTRWRFWERSPRNETPASRGLLSAAPADAAAGIVTDEDVARAAAEMSAAASISPSPALMILGERFGLSRFEQEIFLLCAAMELDTNIASVCGQAQNDLRRPYPTFALAMTLFDEPAWEALSPEGPLRHWRLIEINQPGAQPLITSALRADERIVNFLKGLNYLDDRLTPFLWRESFDEGPAELPPSQAVACETILHRFQMAALQQMPVIQLVGRDTPSKRMIASEVAARLGLRLYRSPVESLPSHAGELETFANLVEREMALWPFALYLDAQDFDKSTNEPQAVALNRFLARSNGIFFLDTREIRHAVARPSINLDIARPSQAEQQTAWAEELGAEGDGIPDLLASQFDMNLGAIRGIAHTTLTEDPAGSSPIGERLWDACRVSVRPRLDSLAQRIQPRAKWGDIVLPETELNLLRQIAAQVKQRGRVYQDWGFAAARTRGLSINALFTGESGTGKTMAAEVIANDLNLDLYRIDLSAVVNKYIGETEKNLRRVFDAAECGGLILFFDEADALFGKRSEVKDSHDRYANIEINYLLQRLESYRGLAIMATNMRSALDTSFMRRIRFIVEFRSHNLTERAAIWQRIFPPETETFGLDYEHLAQLNLNGGSINNVAINAAFLAAHADTRVTMPLVLEAARAEFSKLKRPINDSDFYWHEGVEAAA